MFSLLFNRSTEPRIHTGGLFRAPFARQAGMLVSNDTAVQYSAVFACIRAIAEPLAMLPWRVHRRLQGGGKELLNSSPTDRLLHVRPNPEMSAMMFRQTLIAWALTWGNGYAEIERDSVGRPLALWPIPPDRVEPKRDALGNLVYEISGTRGSVFIRAADMFHLAGLGWDGITGYSIISLARQSIGLGLAAEQFGASYFGNNTVIGGILEHPASLSDQAYSRIKESWNSDHQGPGKSHKPQILEEGMKWNSLAVPPNDSQFLETRQHQVEDIARWFGVKPHKIGLLDRSIKANIESQNIEMVVDTLLPWAIRLEQEADAKLFSRRNSSQLFTKINLNSLLRGDSKARAEFYKVMAALGALSVNEIIELEDGNPIGTVGDKRIVPMNMTTLDRIGEVQDASQPVEHNPDDESGDEHEDDDEQSDDDTQIDNQVFPLIRPFLQDVVSRVLVNDTRAVHLCAKECGEHDDKNSWLNQHYAKQRQFLIDKFKPVAQCLSALLETRKQGPVPTEPFNQLVEHYADWYIENAKAEFAGLQNSSIETLPFSDRFDCRIDQFFTLAKPVIQSNWSPTDGEEPD